MNIKENSYVPTIYFSKAFEETHYSKCEFKSFSRKLKQQYQIKLITTKDSLFTLSHNDILIFGNPRDEFNEEEISFLSEFIEQGGSIIIFLSDNSIIKSKKNKCNLNEFLKKYGIEYNNDFVVSTVPHKKCQHPKEAFISNGFLYLNNKNSNIKKEQEEEEEINQEIEFYYPYGITLNIKSPSVPILSSGNMAYPFNRPLGAFWMKKGNSGKLIVIGSVTMFDDKWIKLESNGFILDFILDLIKNNNDQETTQINLLDFDDSNITEFKTMPNIEALAEIPKCCMKEYDINLHDWTSYLDDDLYSINTSMLPNVISLYKKLNVVKTPLSLVPPYFETPSPPLKPAVFPPLIEEPLPPALELFDLEEELIDPHRALDLLLKKYLKKNNERSLDKFIKKCADVVDCGEHLNSKEILVNMYHEILKFKMSDSLGL